MRYSVTLIIIISLDKESWYKHTQDYLSFAAAGRFELMGTWPSKQIFQFSKLFSESHWKNYNYILLGTHRNGDLLYARLFHISGTFNLSWFLRMFWKHRLSQHFDLIVLYQCDWNWSSLYLKFSYVFQ